MIRQPVFSWTGNQAGTLHLQKYKQIENQKLSAELKDGFQSISKSIIIRYYIGVKSGKYFGA